MALQLHLRTRIQKEDDRWVIFIDLELPSKTDNLTYRHPKTFPSYTEALAHYAKKIRPKFQKMWSDIQDKLGKPGDQFVWQQLVDDIGE